MKYDNLLSDLQAVLDKHKVEIYCSDVGELLVRDSDKRITIQVTPFKDKYASNPRYTYYKIEEK